MKRIGALFLALIVLINGAQIPSFADACTHPYDHVVSVTVGESVCTDHGIGTGTLCFCGDCGALLHTESWSGGDIPTGSYDPVTGTATVSCTAEGCTNSETFTVHVHSWGDPAVTAEAGCMTDGTLTYTCSCGQTMTETLPALGHDWDEGTVTVAPDCTTPGLKTFTCERCGATYTEEVPATGVHSWDEGTVTTQPTCTEDGVKTFTCADCGTTRTEQVPALGGHDWDAGSVTTAPTCGAPGVLTHHCSRCDATYEEPIAPTGAHVWDAGTVTTAPGCDTPGVRTYTCTVCHETRTESIPPTDEHDWDEGTVTLAPTCAAEGILTHHCRHCDATYDEPIPRGGDHVWDEGTVTTAPACGVRGVMTYTCSLCHATYTEDIPALEHDWVFDHEVRPTCDTQGYSVYRCSRCSELRNDDYVPELGHVWGPDEVLSAPDCIHTGLIRHECTVCHEVHTETVSTNEMHDYEVISTVPATCTDDGTVTYRCSLCGHTHVETLPAGHTWVESGRVLPTCVAQGTVHYVCSGCGATKDETLPATGNHDYVEYDNDATCTEGGYSYKRCTQCGTTFMEPVPPLGHDWGPWTVTVAPTCTEAGTETRTCSRGCTETREVEPLEHQYGSDHLCVHCHETYPEVKSVVDQIAALPAVSAIDENNALAVYNRVLAAEAEKNAITGGTNAAHRAALNLYADLAKLNAVKAQCLQYLRFISYDPTLGSTDFRVFWNDNQGTGLPGYRTPAASFLAASHAVLHYEIVSEDGSVVVDSGTLSNMSDAASAFSFLGLTMDTSDSLLEVVDMGTNYEIRANETLPTGYTSVFTDYSTMERYRENFTVRYSLEMENPAPAYYAITSPNLTYDPVVIPSGGSTVLTRQIEWSAEVEWKDDNNRSANGGNSAANRPRVDAETLRNSLKVYGYSEILGAGSAALVTQDFELEISDDLGTVTLKGLPAFNNAGEPMNYYLVGTGMTAANTDAVPGNRYQASFRNYDDNAQRSEGVFNGGTLTETLTNSVMFSVTKIWADGRTPENRPATRFNIWRVTENYDENGHLTVDTAFSYPVPDTVRSYSVPTEDTNVFYFERNLSGVSRLQFPMYDSEGRRYIYYGREAGVPSSYTVIVDNDSANVTDAVRSAFGTSLNRRYFLNGGTIVNTIGEYTDLDLTKSFKALSIQNLIAVNTPMTASFLLQIKDENGDWVTADVVRDQVEITAQYGVVSTVGADNSLTVTLTSFSAENLTQECTCIRAAKFTDDYEIREFRWLETGVSVNGVSATYDPANWVEDMFGGMTYSGDIVVNDGQLSTVLGDDIIRTSGAESTTALFRAIARGNVFTNTLTGTVQIEVKKEFRDDFGNQIANDPNLVGDIVLTFQVTRNGQPFDTFTISYADLVPGNVYWDKLMSYERYDEEGREYNYQVEEVGITGTEREFVQTRGYSVRVMEYPPDSGILVKRLVSSYSNGPSGSALVFEARKQWLDDSDLETRRPVYATLYRFRNVDGTLLPAPEAVIQNIELSFATNWYSMLEIDPQPSVTVDGVTYNDSLANYLLLETSVSAGDGTAVPLGYDRPLTSAEMAALHAASAGSTVAYGTAGSLDDEGDDWDGLTYRYRAFIEHVPHDVMECFTLTNLRIGTQNYLVEKLWKAGGTVRTSTFALYCGSTRVGTYTLDIDPQTRALSIVSANWENGYENGSYTVQPYGSATLDEDGNIQGDVLISGLPKFDANGCQLVFTVKEIAITDSNGVSVPITNSKCVVDGITYTVQSSSVPTLAPEENHRSPDLYTYSIVNSQASNYDIVSNKIWRDDWHYVRPDITFTVYRMSTKNAQLRALVDAGDTAALSAYLAQHVSTSNRVAVDRVWDTQINSFWWTCTIESVPQFDEDGFPYVYYAIEHIADKDAGTIYRGYYSNLTMDTSGYWPTAPTGSFTTRDVYGIPNSQLLPMNGNVLILSDGIHQSAPGVFSNYYSATVVNRPEFTVSLSGRKLWMLPDGWVVSEDNMPEIQVDLYRTTDDVFFTDAESFVQDVLDNAVGGCLNTARIGYSLVDSYQYTFDQDSDGNQLQMFDEWGTTYHYYVIENGIYTNPAGSSAASVRCFPTDLIVYDSNNISNIYSAEPPYVEISVRKVWQLSPEIIAQISRFGLTSLTEDDFAPANVNLYGIPTNKYGNEISGTRFDFGSVSLRPGVFDSDGDGVNDTQFTILTGPDGACSLEATYTFKTFYNSQTGRVENLPYYWMFNYPTHYYLDETHTHGYTENFATTQVVLDGTRNETVGGETVEIRYNTNTNLVNFLNVYDGERTTFSFRKYWNDAYVGNDDYRPDEITFTVMRRVGSVSDPDFSQTVTLYKADFRNTNLWEGQVSGLLKYAPSGELYTYYVAAESITFGGSTVTASHDGDPIGNYHLSNHTDTLWTNTLNSGKSISASKTWTVMGTPVTAYTTSDNRGFDDLRRFDALPQTVVFYVQRRVAGLAWEYVPASNHEDDVHRVLMGSNYVLGHAVDLDEANEDNFLSMLNAQMTWINLPENSILGDRYEYRVIEVLTWHDGTVDTVLANGLYRNDTATFTQNADGTAFGITNDLGLTRVRLAKVWDDNHGSENGRPSSITITVVPNGAAGTEADGRSFVLQTSGHSTAAADSEIYYSEYFYLPVNVALTYGVPGASYTITESFTLRNGTAYTQTVDSTGDHVQALADGSYVLHLINSADITRKTYKLTASKTWSGDSVWQAVTRPAIKFKIQYYDRATSAWTDITDANKAQFTADPANFVCVQTVTAATSWKASWNTVYKYWDTPSVDGVAEFIRYRAVEIIDNTPARSSYSNAAREWTGITHALTTKNATITNTLSQQTLTISKAWTKNGTADRLTTYYVERLVNLNAIPKYITFQLQYKDSTMSDFAPIPGTSTVTYLTKTLMTSQTTSLKFPRYDRFGQAIEYRVVETSVEYANAETYSVDWNSTFTLGQQGSFTTVPAAVTWSVHSAAVVNDYSYTDLTITKLWKDEDNRDGLRADISVTLSRDGSSYSVVNTATENNTHNSLCTVTKTGNVWTLFWEYLPMYKYNALPVAGNESVYTWAETTGVTGYGIVYDADGTARTAVENDYQPMRGDISAVKVWDDENNEYNTRPTTVYLKLQYLNQSGSFADVPTGVLVDVNGKWQYQDPDGTKVYTTSDAGWRAVTAGSSWTALWENLPLNYVNTNGSSARVTYRVVEGQMNADGTVSQIAEGGTLHGYTVHYTTCSLSQNAQVRSTNVTNVLDTTTLTVTKNWLQDTGLTSLVRPASVTFVLQWRKAGETVWNMIPEGLVPDVTLVDGESRFTVFASANWTKTLQELPVKDADGVAYEYRATEAVIHYAAGDVAVNAADSMVGPYDIANVTVNCAFANGVYSASFDNTLHVGSLTARKIWNDANDRDGGRCAITVYLYRVTVDAAGHTVTQEVDHQTLNGANGFTYTWTNLPMRNNNADETTDYCEYYVTESRVTGGIFTNAGIQYTVTDGAHTTVATPAEVTVTNTHVPLTVDLTAVKNWLDTNNKIDVRPSSVVFKLQYRIGLGWTDFPAANILGNVDPSVLLTLPENQVYMVSAGSVTQTLTAANGWTASWTGLTAYARVDGVTYPVQYRVVEDTSLLLNYTAQNNGASNAVTIGSSTHTLTVSNAPDLGSITVGKNMTVNGTAITGSELSRLVEVLHVLPENLTVTLSYYDGPTLKTETATISYNRTAHAYGTCTFTDLPVAYADGTPVDYTVSDSAAGCAFMICGTTSGVNVTSVTVPGTATVTNDYEAGSLTVGKIWDDVNNRDGGRCTVIVELYRDGVRIDTQNLSAANGWSHTWNNLPVYQNASATTKSVYTVKEGYESAGTVTLGGLSYGVAYSAPVTLVTGETATASVTNTHQPLTFTLDASKLWEDSANRYGLRPGSVDLTLVWATDPAASVWTPVTRSAAADTTGTAVTTTSAVTQTLSSANRVSASVWGSATWENLPAYVLVDDGTGSLVSTLVCYKVVEASTAASYTSADSAVVTYLNHDTVDVQVENELTDTVDVTVRKLWNDQNARYAARPATVSVQLQYTSAAAPTEADWADLDGIAAVLTAANGWTYTWEDLPAGYSYRVVELGMTYGITFTAMGSVVAYESSSTVTAAGVTEITNTLVTGSVTVTKNWDDMGNRDGGRRPVTVNLLRDGVVIESQVLSDANSWTCTWTELPVYRDGSSVKSVYSVKEVGETGRSFTGQNSVPYTVTYSGSVVLTKNGTASVSVTNTHVPYSFDIDAAKVWNDMSDRYGLRPATVKLTLVWSTDPAATVWNTVTQSAAPDATGLTVTTSSAPTQTLTRPAGAVANTWTGAEWNDLPAYVLVDDGTGSLVSALIYYKVTETYMSGLTTSYNSADSAVVTYLNHDTVEVKVINSLTDVTYATVRKVWDDQGAQIARRPDSITVKLQYTAAAAPAEADWTDLPGCEAVLTASSATPWEYTWMDLSKDYRYRVVETGITYGTGAAARFIPLSQVVGYETESEIVADSNGDPTITVITNTLRTGSLEVIKVWEDADDRFEQRPEYVTFRLYRVGETAPIAHKTVAVTATGTEACVFTDLPIYVDGSDAFCAYYVTEDVPAGYVFSSSVTASTGITLADSGSATVTVTNRGEFENLTVTKEFVDNDDHELIDYMPAAIRIQLQYRAAGSEEWLDWPDGEIELTEAMGWTYRFDSLPCGNEYRAIETGVELDGVWYAASGVRDIAGIYRATLGCFDQSAITGELYDEVTGKFLGYTTTVTNTLWVIPNTGDASLLVYGIALTASAAGLIFLPIRRKKKEEDED